jgi:hypothetical protein
VIPDFPQMARRSGEARASPPAGSLDRHRSAPHAGSTTRPVRVAAGAVLCAMLLSSCFSIPLLDEDDFPIEKIDEAYRARDTCLKWTAFVFDDGSSEMSEITRTVALSCGRETSALVAVLNPHEDAKVSEAIARDSEFRASGYVARLRNAVARASMAIRHGF